MATRNISILGSTGSIGTQTLDIVRQSPDMKILGLCANRNVALIELQAREFQPKLIACADAICAADLKIRLADTAVRVAAGNEGVCEVAALSEVDTVVAAMSGISGLRPTWQAIEAGKTIALANKETLVAAGDLVVRLAAHNKVSLLPVDSEHSAVFQSLAGLKDKKHLHKIILTASGGPFRGRTRKELQNITPQQALKHPNWEMGAKVTIDSATLANKGLEVIEARWLFDVRPEQIEVVVHPQSIVHSMAEFADGSVIAQLGLPDMHLPIAYALTYPDRMALAGEKLNISALGNLSFSAPDTDAFPALALARRALDQGGTMCAVFNGADEAAVELFLNGKLSFLGIPTVIERAMDAYNNTQASSLDDILAADRWARDYVLGFAKA